MGRVLYASFDEVPSFKGAATHILAFAGRIAAHRPVDLLTLGAVTLPAFAGFRHLPLALTEANVLRRGLAFREAVGRRLRSQDYSLFHCRSPWEGLAALDLDVPLVYELNGLASIELPYHYPTMTEHSRAVLRADEARLIARATRIVCPSSRTRACVGELFGSDALAKTSVISNGYEPMPATGPRSKRDARGRLKLVYLGTMTSWQGLVPFLRALRPHRDRLSLDVFGPGQERLGRAMARRLARWQLEDCVTLRGPLARYEATRVLPDYALGVCPLTRSERNLRQGCCPIKIIDYLAAGIGVLAPDLEVTRSLARREELGHFYAGTGVGALTVALEAVLDAADAWTAPAFAPSPLLAGLPTWAEAGNALCEVYAAALGCSPDHARASHRHDGRRGDQALEA